MLSGMIISSKLKISHLPTVNRRNKHRKNTSWFWSVSREA